MSAPGYGRLPRMIEAVARAEGVTVRSVMRDVREQPQVRVRRAVSVVARRAGYSFPVIGRALDRDHTTIMHHVRCAEGLANDADFAELCRIAEAVQ